MKLKSIIILVLAAILCFSFARASSGPGQGCVSVGTAPFCNGDPSDCYQRGKKYCGPSKTGAACWTGTKVLCCNKCP